MILQKHNDERDKFQDKVTQNLKLGLFGIMLILSFILALVYMESTKLKHLFTTFNDMINTEHQFVRRLRE